MILLSEARPLYKTGGDIKSTTNNNKKMYHGTRHNYYGNYYTDMIDENGNPLAFNYYDKDGRAHYINRATGETYASYKGDYDEGGITIRPNNYRSSYDPNGVTDFMNILTLGALNRLSVSQDIGIIKDIVNGRNAYDVISRSILGNDGAFKNPLANFALDFIAPSAGALGLRIGKAWSPQNIRNIVFDNKAPFSYKGAGKAAKSIIKDILSLRIPNPAAPKWEQSARNTAARMSEFAKSVGSNIPADAIYQARRDAWAMHNKIPQMYDTFEEIAPNTYTARKDVQRVLENDRTYPIANYDYFNTSGGNVSEELIPLSYNTDNGRSYALLRQTDINDYNPFFNMLTNDGISPNKSLKGILRYNWANGPGKFIQNRIRIPLFDKGILGMNGIAPNWVKRLENKTLNKYRNEMPFDKFISNIIDKFNIGNKIANFEVGDITGGKPFKVINELPVTIPNDEAYNGFVYPGFIDANSIEPRVQFDKISLTRPKHKSGGSIHINPANRGKFTATMKRTGKTAEELSHSSNPLTRKRAIFALNARKWNH